MLKTFLIVSRLYQELIQLRMIFLVMLMVFIFLLAQIQCVELSVLILIGESFKLSSDLWPQSGLGSCISAACGVNQRSQYRSCHAAALQHTRESSTCTGSIIGLLREALVSYWSTRLLHHSVLLPSRLLSFTASFSVHPKHSAGADSKNKLNMHRKVCRYFYHVVLRTVQ